jgi:MFS family permease
MATLELPLGPTRRLGLPRLILLSSYWVALGYLWLPLGSSVLPDVILRLVGDAHKGTATAVLEGVGTFLSIFVQPVMGAISDRTSSRFGRRKPYLVVGTLGSCLFLLLMILAGSFFWLLGLYFLLQLSENCAQGPYQGLLPDAVPEAERSRASGLVGGGNLVGLALGTAVVGTFMAQHPARLDLAIFSMVFVLLLATLVVVVAVPDRAKPAAGLRSSLYEVTLGTFRISPRLHRDFLWLMASRLLILVSIAGLQSFAFFYFKDVFFPGAGDSARAAAQAANRDLQVVIIVFALAATYPAAAISGHIGRRPLIVLAGLAGGIGTLGLILAPYGLLPAALVQPVASLFAVPPAAGQALYFGVLVGIASGAFLSVDWAFLCDVIPAAEAGRFLGFSNIATASAGVVGRLVGGPLIDTFNARGTLLRQPGGYPVAFGVYVGFFVLGTLAILMVREAGRGPAPAPAGVAA